MGERLDMASEKSDLIQKSRLFQHEKLGQITWIVGNSGSGKTTLAMQLLNGMPDGYPIILDGDELRECWELGFSVGDRAEQNMRAMRVANLLCRQGHDVVIATICPYTILRRWLVVHSEAKIRWIYLPGGDDRGEPFELAHTL